MASANELPARRTRARRLGGVAAGLVVLAFLLAAVIRGADQVADFDWQFDPWFLVLAAGGATGSLATMGAGYVLLLERLADRRLPRGRLLSVWSRSLLARYVPGNVMMVAGRVVLGREAGVGGRVSLAASVYEQAFLLGLSALGAIGLLLDVGDLGQGPWLWLVAAVPLGLLLLHPRVFEPLSRRVLRRLGREPLETLLSIREILLLAAVYAVAYVSLCIGVWATVRGFTGDDAGGPLLVGAGFLLSYVILMLAFVFPSGIGVREGIFALVLARELPGAVAIAAAAATRLVLTLTEIAFAAAVVGIERRRRARRAAHAAAQR